MDTGGAARWKNVEVEESVRRHGGEEENMLRGGQGGCWSRHGDKGASIKLNWTARNQEIFAGADLDLARGGCYAYRALASPPELRYRFAQLLRLPRILNHHVAAKAS
ncbi:hypothetical protein MTR_1g085480 [Medicago truncatula]|uniref:Uncharacterized protein n=1 Tax=Medicago truncatula TaxID=3880 RepID=A0A072VNZ6_MEDTR|nr:hypothetical protein MTR_1g085480 [Medicago truncatula]